MVRICCLALGTLAILAAPGCDRGPILFQVTGQVTFGGKPLPAGVIYFDPDYMKKNDGPQGYAHIKDGQFSTRAVGGRGVIGGPHLARIEGFDGQPASELPMGRPLFTNFSQPIDLPKADTQVTFDVPAE